MHSEHSVTHTSDLILQFLMTFHVSLVGQHIEPKRDRIEIASRPCTKKRLYLYHNNLYPPDSM